MLRGPEPADELRTCRLWLRGGVLGSIRLSDQCNSLGYARHHHCRKSEVSNDSPMKISLPLIKKENVKHFNERFCLEVLSKSKFYIEVRLYTVKISIVELFTGIVAYNLLNRILVKAARILAQLEFLITICGNLVKSHMFTVFESKQTKDTHKINLF